MHHEESQSAQRPKEVLDSAQVAVEVEAIHWHVFEILYPVVLDPDG